MENSASPGNNDDAHGKNPDEVPQKENGGTYSSANSLREQKGGAEEDVSKSVTSSTQNNTVSDADSPVEPGMNYTGDPENSPASEQQNAAKDAGSSETSAGAERSQLMQFLKTLASFSGDLSQLTCPSFLLSGVSMLEYSVHWGDHPDLLCCIPAERSPELRMASVLRWFISTLYGSFYSRCKTGTEKKPFNPVLGERFIGQWVCESNKNKQDTLNSKAENRYSEQPGSPLSGQSNKYDMKLSSASASRHRYTKSFDNSILSQSERSESKKSIKETASVSKVHIEEDGSAQPKQVSSVSIALLSDEFESAMSLKTNPETPSPSTSGRFSKFLRGEKKISSSKGNSLPSSRTSSKEYCAPSFPRTSLVCEQVSHHPPVSSFFIQNDSMDVFVSGHCGQRTRFRTTYVRVEQTGRTVVSLRLPDSTTEEYLITLPELALRGLLTAQLFIELVGGSVIQSTSGYSAYVEFIPKPWIGGEYHTIKGAIIEPEKNKGSGGQPVFLVGGNWTKSSWITHVASNTTFQLFDTDEKPIVELQVAPRKEQHPLESRNLWHDVSTAISSGAFTEATKHKLKIENEQRALRRERASSNLEWRPAFFTRISDLQGTSSEGGVSAHAFLTSHTLALVTGLRDAATAFATLSSSSKVSEQLSAYLRIAASAVTTIDDGLWVHNSLLEKTQGPVDSNNRTAQ